MKKPLFANDRLPHKLVTVGDIALTSADEVFTEIVGVPVREVRILRLIDDNPGITFIEIVTATHLERSFVSRMIQKLSRRGLIERRATEADARRYQLYTNAEGKALRARARALSDRLEAIVLTPLAREDAAAIAGAMGTLMEWLEGDTYRAMLAECLADWTARPDDAT